MKKPKQRAEEIHSEIYNSLINKFNNPELCYELAIELSLIQINQSIEILNELVEYRELQYWTLVNNEVIGLKKSPSFT